MRIVLNKIDLSLIQGTVLPCSDTMKKAILVLGILFILLAAGAVGVLLYANRYVQSPAFKERLVAEISKVTGGTVQIDTINVSLTSRVEVGGIKMDLGDAKQGSQAFTTKNFLVK